MRDTVRRTVGAVRTNARLDTSRRVEDHIQLKKNWNIPCPALLVREKVPATFLLFLKVAIDGEKPGSHLVYAKDGIHFSLGFAWRGV